VQDINTSGKTLRAVVHVDGDQATGRFVAGGSALCKGRCLQGTMPPLGRGSGPGSCRPRAHVACVVWAWDLFVAWRLCRGIPAPVGLQFFALRFVTVLSSNGFFSPPMPLRWHRGARRAPTAAPTVPAHRVLSTQPTHRVVERSTSTARPRQAHSRSQALAPSSISMSSQLQSCGTAADGTVRQAPRRVQT